MNWEAKPAIHSGSISQKKGMNWEAKPIIDSGSTNLMNGSIPELISSVRSAFRQIDFDKVEKDLLRREEDLKRYLSDTSMEATKWKKSYESMEKKHGELMVIKLEIEDDLKKRKIECGDLREKVIQLGEDKRVYSDRERRANERYEKLIEDFNRAESEKKQMIVEIRNETVELKNENAELKNAKNEAEANVENWKNIYKRLEERVSRLEKEFDILMQKIEGMRVENSGNEKSQNDIGVDTDSPDLMGLQINGRQADCCEKTLPSPGACSACNSPVIGSNSKPEEDPHSINMACYNEALVGKKLVFEARRHGTATDAIEINDSDDEVPLSLRFASLPGVSTACSEVILSEKETTSQMLPKTVSSGQTGGDKGVNCGENDLMLSMSKRKRASSSEKHESEDDDNMPIGKLRKRIQDLSHESIVFPVDRCLANPDLDGTNIAKPISPSGSNPVFIRQCEEKAEAEHKIPSRYSDSDDSSDSGDDVSDSQMNYLIAKLQMNRNNKAWAHKADMLQALEKDPELCMNAVCALYRQQTSLEKSAKSSLFSKDRGFNQFDVIRGTQLAVFLLAGDRHGELKKTVSELQEYDPKALDDCRKLANRHSTKLFDIYQKQKDPFFHP